MVHKFKALGVMCALDVCSGAVHVLDKEAYEMLDFFTENGDFLKEEAEMHGFSDKKHLEAADELISLRDENLLFTKDIYKAITEHSEK